MARTTRSKTAAADEKDIKTWGSGGLFANRELGSLFLMVVPPLMVYLLWHAAAGNGSFMDTLGAIHNQGFINFWNNELYPGV